ncbi:hypothetical protein A3D80_02050 [Candidatus Roizmanbacteria bacterium RIFCSPHIGHO2_02_FULL_40_13b]|uniref:Uncharacterized protein n=1 Tax=Candidatus Roizmanbacteria bacterium RIFCSPHIGHO2_01_FULL_39_24 TaxID=1802032 RepID=A0A1F7GL96_9BACT|nr:MAG: hypothetical protein A2799_01410 [Candidatus Roizmanbacteria bacterium RIFCSPHIGHO2_01_FULL_39_24]OGK26908.1 MAG: hypothetical protein A3D80_02050 [Candidatus Roizmanbacteria bacterium RIFCSPHIGHO2_02_FULL_40_13b]OGK49458.1 MAG: hypothetical protein A3A56_03585 [Candidatus Roizmanbacteria bacterium RIFCSPLOWO2_01_FULL_40_32]
MGEISWRTALRPNWRPSVAYNGLFQCAQCAKIDKGIIAYYGIVCREEEFGGMGDRVMGRVGEEDGEIGGV